MKFSRVEFYGDEYCARNSAVAKAQNSASRANYNVNFKIYIVKFYGARFGRNFTEQNFKLRRNGACGAKFKKAAPAASLR